MLADPSPRVSGSRGIDPGRLGAITQLLFAGILAAVLLVVTDSRGDAVPRPLVLAVLYGTPGVVGLLGVAGHRRSLLLGAAIPLVPGAVLSWAGVTLIFAIPAGLLDAAAVALRPDPRRTRDMMSGLLGSLIGGLVAALILVAGWATLLGFTAESCWSMPGGVGCGSGLITTQGMLVGGVCLLAVIAVSAAWAATGRRASR